MLQQISSRLYEPVKYLYMGLLRPSSLEPPGRRMGYWEIQNFQLLALGFSKTLLLLEIANLVYSANEALYQSKLDKSPFIDPLILGIEPLTQIPHTASVSHACIHSVDVPQVSWLSGWLINKTLIRYLILIYFISKSKNIRNGNLRDFDVYSMHFCWRFTFSASSFNLGVVA